MKFMMLLKADKRTEAGELPSRQDLEQMGKYNQELIDAGVMLDGAGLQASSNGARVTWKQGKPEVTDGPFPEAKEQIGGFWIIEAENLDAALDWASQATVACRGPVEVRPFQDNPEG